MLTEWINRLRHLRGRGRFDSSLDDEIRFHLETRAEELARTGVARNDAVAQARREFGNVALVQENSRSPWRFRWLEDLAADVRYALRSFRRSSAFTLTAVLSLTLGIGGACAIYSALDAVLWRPLPVAEPNRLVTFEITRENGAPETDLPAALISQLRASGLFDGLAAVYDDGLSFAYDGRTERIIGEAVSADYFDALGVAQFLGQNFTPEVRAGRWAPEAVLSYNFWRRRFGGDPGVIGRTIRLNTYPFTIVGVSPSSFHGVVRATEYELRIPIMPAGRELPLLAQVSGKPSRWLNVLARLGPETSIVQAQAEADAQFRQFLRTTPMAKFQNTGMRHLRLLPGSHGYDWFVHGFRMPLYVLLALVVIVLLIVCSNLANMLLARAGARTREFAIRASIGAGRLRLIRQLLTESLLLSIIGGTLGIALAQSAAVFLFRFLPQGHISLAIDLHPNRSALLFTSAVSLVTGLLFGLAPALQASRGSIAGALCAVGIGMRFRNALVIAQVAFSLVLLVAAGVFVRTLAALRPSEFRANPDRLLLFTMKPQQELYSDEARSRLAAELIRRMSALRGVESAAMAECGPLGSRTGSDLVDTPGQPPFRAASDVVSPGFFATVGIPMLGGRDFEVRETHGAPLVAIVNETLARTRFPNQNPLGRKLHIPMGKSDGTYEIVGVVADTHYYDVHHPPEPFVWYLIGQMPPYIPTLYVRIRGAETAGVISAVRREFDAIDKGFPVFNIRAMQGRIEDSLSSERMVAGLSGAFGMLALALAAIGLYGILAYAVSRRTREIGVRVALGASPRSVIWMVAHDAFALVAAGSVAGLALAVATSRYASQHVDALTALCCTLAMFLIAAAASAIPALRACRIDPVRALRHD